MAFVFQSYIFVNKTGCNLPNLVRLLARVAAAVSRQPFDRHSERLLACHRHVVGGVGRRSLDDELRPGRQDGHVVADDALVDAVVLLLEVVDGEGALVQLVTLLGQLVTADLTRENMRRTVLKKILSVLFHLDIRDIRIVRYTSAVQWLTGEI